MKTRFAFILLLAIGLAEAHDLQHSVDAGPAVVVRLFYSDQARFAGEPYEVFRAGETTPYQTGRTDALGRVVFVPDRAGEWQVRSRSVEGHGVDVRLKADGATVTDLAQPLFDRYARVITGVAILFGFFGAFALFARKGRT